MYHINNGTGLTIDILDRLRPQTENACEIFQNTVQSKQKCFIIRIKQKNKTGRSAL